MNKYKQGCLGLLLLALSGTSFAQGSLEPAGLPGPTMKTLDQVEARTPVSAAGTLSASGSYYLTNDITGTIVIGADHVDLDLNGFTVFVGTAAGVIDLDNRRNVRIYNGAIVDGTHTGILANGSGELFLRDIRLSNFGDHCVRIDSLTGPIHLERIHCYDTEEGGIFIRRSDADPMYVEVRDSVVINTNTSTGVSEAGLMVFFNGTGEMHVVITGNRFTDNRTWGLRADCTECTAYGEITGNLAQNNGSIGFLVTQDFLFAKNRAVDNATNYSVTSTRAAPITALDDTPGPWDNITE